MPNPRLGVDPLYIYLDIRDPTTDAPDTRIESIDQLSARIIEPDGTVIREVNIVLTSPGRVLILYTPRLDGVHVIVFKATYSEPPQAVPLTDFKFTIDPSSYVE